MMTLADAGALSRTLFARGLAIEPAPVISPPVLIAFPAAMALANMVAAAPRAGRRDRAAAGARADARHVLRDSGLDWTAVGPGPAVSGN
jgi:hypothetical protein